MTWFEKIIPSRIKTERRTRSVPEGLWMKCPACDSVLYRPEVERNLRVCPKCAHHMRIGARDGNHTAASQFPNVLTSEVHGTRMSQLRPPANWNMEESSNTFFMFCDAGYNAARLAPGWRIRGIRLEGTAWRWVICPVSGANTASFSVRIHSYKNQETATSVHLAGLTLEGPDGATDWKEAFPNLTPVPAAEGTTPAAPAAAEPPALAEAREPELPQ